MTDVDWFSASDASITENHTYIPPELLDSTCTPAVEQSSGKDTDSFSTPPSFQKEVGNATAASSGHQEASSGHQAASSLLSSLDDQCTEERNRLQTGTYDCLEKQEKNSHSSKIHSNVLKAKRRKLASGVKLPYESIPLLSTTDTNGSTT